MKKTLKKRTMSSKKAGLPPGTPVYTGDSTVSEVKIIMMDYNKESCIIKPMKHFKDSIPFFDNKSVTWINITGLREVNLIDELGNFAGLHPLIIEDILHTQQRPKIETYEGYIFIVMKMIILSNGNMSENFDFEQFSLILGKNYVLSFLENDHPVFDEVVNRITNNMGKIRNSGSDYLAYRLIDVIVDNYFKMLEVLGDRMEDLEVELVEHPTRETLHKIHGLKRELIFVRKSIWPLREVISALERDEGYLIKRQTHVYLRDLYDHTIQIIDTVETFRDLIGGMLEVYLSSISNKMNEIMKVLTIFTAIFIPLSVIAGIYGMNFKTEVSPYNMPELNWVYGYPFALGLMAAVAATLLLIFKKKKWF